MATAGERPGNGTNTADASSAAANRNLRLSISHIRRPGEVSAAAQSAISGNRKRKRCIRRSASIMEMGCSSI